MEFRTINDLNEIIKSNLYKVSQQFDLIVAVPRSGFLPATILSLYLNIPMTDMDNFLNNKIYSLGKTKIRDNWIKNLEEARNILIVEDSSASGNSLKKVKEDLEKSPYKDKCKILAIFVTKETIKYTDLYFDICPTPRMFEWNYIHHQGVKNACFDMDGVLCEDPTEKENDDGEKYINFIKNAKPKFIPTFEIGYIVTSRLEKYRKETEEWLNKNNIKYKKLIMLDLPSREERIKTDSHGKFKGKVYKELRDTSIFIESEEKQAKEINEISGKFVFCTANSNSLKDNWKTVLKKSIKKIIPAPIKKILKGG